MADTIITSGGTVGPAASMHDAVLYQQASGADPALVYTAADFRSLIDVLFTTSGVVNTGSDPAVSGSSLKVIQRTGGASSTEVTIKRGTIILPMYGTAVSADGSSTAPGKYVARLTSDMNITVPPAPASGTLIHTVIAYANDRSDAPVAGISGYGWVIHVREGTLNGVAPTVPAGALVLATISRAAGSGTIQTAAITDARIFASAASGIPRGGIIMWSGSVASVPLGWALCDGAQGTPDLRGRFIVGASVDSGGTNTLASYNKGATGGEDAHALTVSEMAAHNHTTANHNHGWGGGHAHVFAVTGAASGSGRYAVNKQDSYGSAPAPTSYTSHAGDHVHADEAVVINSAGSGTAHENRPRFFALAYIMKL